MISPEGEGRGEGGVSEYIMAALAKRLNFYLPAVESFGCGGQKCRAPDCEA